MNQRYQMWRGIIFRFPSFAAQVLSVPLQLSNPRAQQPACPRQRPPCRRRSPQCGDRPQPLSGTPTLPVLRTYAPIPRRRPRAASSPPLRSPRLPQPLCLAPSVQSC